MGGPPGGGCGGGCRANLFWEKGPNRGINPIWVEVLRKKSKKRRQKWLQSGSKYIPTVPLRGSFHSAVSGPADRRRIMSAAQGRLH